MSKNCFIHKSIAANTPCFFLCLYLYNQFFRKEFICLNL